MPLLLAGAALCAPARADPSPQTRLEAVEKAIDESRARQDAATQAADALAAEIATLQAQAVAAAQAAQAHEASLTAIDAQLASLAAEERGKSQALERDRAHQTQLLMALVRVAAAPPEALALAPGPPVDALRGALLMGSAVPPLAAQAAGLKQQIAALEGLRADIAATREHQRGEREGLAAETARIAQLLARKAALRAAASKSADEAGQQRLALAAQAGSLRELIDRLDQAQRKAEEAARVAALRPPPEPQAGAAIAVTAPPPVRLDPSQPRHVRPFAEAQGAMVFPASGTLVGHWGAPDGYGGTSRGLTIETRPGAEIVAPFDGQVVFAGPFRGYGQILIIGHGDGYHSLLAGLDRIDSSVGQWLVAGEPVGTMSDGAGKPRLYLELRHNNQPINPTPWLATRAEKVNG